MSARAEAASGTCGGEGPVRERRSLPPAGRGPAAAEELAIAGLVPLSSVDWPGHLVATVFCQGCPWRCTYCHNTAILDTTTPGAVPFADLESLLRRRRGLLDGVVFSGGEATLQHALVPAVHRVRQAGFAVGLHTGGAYPSRLRSLLAVDRRGARTGPSLVDWVGFDVKASPAGYAELVGRRGAVQKVMPSLTVLLASGVDHELRMTVTPALVPQVEPVLHTVAEAGGAAIVLQRARAEGADAAFAAGLEAEADWPARFDEAVAQARALGDQLGLEVRSRAA